MADGNYRMLVSDLDGTLLRPDRTLSKRTVAALKRAQAVGHCVLIASGRPPRFIRPLLQQHELDLPFAAYNGAAIFPGPASDEPLWQQPIEAATLHKLIAALRAHDPDLNLRLEAADRNYSDRIDEGMAERIRRGITEPPHQVGPLEAALAAEQLATVKVLVGVGLPHIVATIAHVEGLRLDVYATTSGEGWLEVMAAGVDKARAAAKWAEREGIAAAQVIACGDQHNDIPMLRWAGLGVAVANAEAEVQAVADHITASNEDDGVAQVIEQFLLKANTKAASNLL